VKIYNLFAVYDIIRNELCKHNYLCHVLPIMWLSVCPSVCLLATLLAEQMKVLGVVLGQRPTFEKHATAVAKLCNYHAQAIRHIRHLLTPDLVQTLACSLMLSRIDCCNALLHGTPDVTIHKLQRVQNNTARIVFQAPRRSDAKPLLCRLHWLPKETSTRGSSTRWSC